MENFATTPSPEATEVLTRRIIKGIYTHLPAIITSFNPETQIAKVVPVVQSTINIDNKIRFEDLPELIEVPVLFCYGKTSGFSLTFPVNVGDECLLSFSMKSFDNWHETGDISKAVEPIASRSHNISDAIAFVGLSSKPNVITDFNNNCIEIRDKSRGSRVSVFKDHIEVVAASTISEPVPAAYSTVNMTLSGFSGTNLPAGIIVSDPDNQVDWTTDNATIIPFGGSIDVQATSTIKQAFNYPANTITRIITPVDGLNAVTNAVASIPGNLLGTKNVITGFSTITLFASGEILVNPSSGTTRFIGNIEATGTIDGGVDVTTNGISLKTHVHPITSGSSSPGPTGTPV